MPVTHLTNNGIPEEYLPLATEQELLDFVNAVRGIGGGNILNALLPGIATSASHCLVAQNLNFSCAVAPADGSGLHGKNDWGMLIRGQAELVKRIAQTLQLQVNPYNREELILPAHIKNAARAFDGGVAFQKYTARVGSSPPLTC